MKVNLPYRLRALAATCLLGLGLATASLVVATPAGAVTSTAHPYSDPIWYPMHAKVYLDCVRTNPGCAGSHDGWTMDFVRETVPDGSAAGDLGVYAMGAGRLFVGDAQGPACREGAAGSFGTWVWIDHGGGVTSRYGHLKNNSTLANGTYVAAGQRIGTMGTTGKGGNCAVPYLDFQVRHGGVGGPRIEIRTLRVCTPQGAQNWPADLNATAHWRPLHPLFPKPDHPVYYPTWNDVPKRSVDFPVVTGSCIPDSVPPTPDRPTGVSVSRAGSGRLAVRWSPAGSPPATRVQVRLSEYHTSTHTWDYVHRERVVYLSPATTAYTFGGLLDGRPYRAAVSFHNAAGWSLRSPWVIKTPAAPPDAPLLRSLYVSGTTSAVIHFKWQSAQTHGVPVTAYQAQVRRVLRSGYTVWRTSLTQDTYRTWRDLRRHATYQVRVRALSSLGPSPFLQRTVKT